MPEDKYEKLGPMLSDIGSEVARIVGGNPDGAYLYAEAGEGWYGSSIFQAEGEAVRYFDPSSELSDLIYDFWLAEDPDKRWSVMQFEITGTKFDAHFKFPDEVPVESFADDDRREIALKKHYGDKPVIYPPMPEFMKGAPNVSAP